ncbi:MAG TPA: helix-turn-helix transcriptional regulator [Chryseosolibacter sp.]
MIAPGFGKRLSSLRKQKGYSTAALAAALAITPHAVRYFEREQRRPKWKVLVRMAEILDTSELFLVCGKKGPATPPPHDTLDRTYALIRSMIREKGDLAKLDPILERFLNAQLRKR